MLTTKQKIIIGNSNKLNMINDNTVDLVITSPPYPMIKMWDNIFYSLNNDITKNLIESNPYKAFELMHKELDKVYDECIKKLKTDGVFIINIGDATRKINNNFELFSNSTRTINYFLSKGFHLLPGIIWNKPTNSPNKFMGSGMLPVGAYNTLEYENILIFRRGKRKFVSKEEKNKRMKSGFFWSERNVWCSNIWKIVGTRQKNYNKSRERNGAFPIEIAYRLISLWSVEDDYVLDPFGGTGTTIVASTALKRNGILIEIEKEFSEEIIERVLNSKNSLNKKNVERINTYKKNSENLNKKLKYYNEDLKCKVFSKQETNINIPIIDTIQYDRLSNEIIVSYKKII